MEASTREERRTVSRERAPGLELAAHARARRRRRRRWAAANLAADGTMLVLAAAAAAIGARATDIPYEGVGWQAAFGALVLAGLRVRGMYALRLNPSIIDMAARIVGVTGAAALAVIAVRVLLESDVNVARQTLRLWAFAAVYLTAGRAGLELAMRRARRRGETEARTVVVGTGGVGQKVARRLLERRDIGLRPVALVDDDPMPVASDLADELELVETGERLERYIVERDVQYAIVGFTTVPHPVLLGVLRRLQALGVSVLMVPRFYEGMSSKLHVDHLGGLPMLGIHPVDPRGWQFAIKYALDRVAAAALLVALAPVLAATALAIRLTSPGPILFRQARVGRDGQEFDMLKFRSMRIERAAGGDFELPAGVAPGGIEGEDRRTPIGAFLRRWSLDELPQLLNVLRGEMSLVGPRPERPGYARRFGEDIHRYDERHRVKSGLTGWAQVHGLRGRTSLVDRVEWDNYYIENWSLLLDLKILLLTVAAVVRSPGS